MSHENTQQKQAGSIGGKTNGDKKRRDMTNACKSRKDTCGIVSSKITGYEYGMIKQVSRACDEFFRSRKMSVYNMKTKKHEVKQ